MATKQQKERAKLLAQREAAKGKTGSAISKALTGGSGTTIKSGSSTPKTTTTIDGRPALTDTRGVYSDSRRGGSTVSLAAGADTPRPSANTYSTSGTSTTFGTGVFDDKLRPGQIRDPKTNKIYSIESKKGQELLGDQQMPTTPTTEEVMSYEDIAKGMAEADYAANLQTQKDLGLDVSEQDSTLDQYFQSLVEEQKRSADYEASQLAYQKKVTAEQTSQARNVAESQQDAITAQLYGGREGVTSMSNISTLGRLKEATQTYIDRLIADQNNVFAQIEDAKIKLDQAVQSGNRELANQYSNMIAGYEQQAKAIDTDYINALSTQLSAESDYQKTQSAITQSGIQTFQGLVESGTDMDLTTISGYASQLNLPTELLLGYYEGAQAIRDDKTLDNQTKAIELAQLNQDLSDQINNIQTTQAQNVEYLKKLYQSGASEEIISAFKSAAGITDLNDPLTQAELAYRSAQTAYQQSATASNLQDLLIAQQQYNDVYGAQTYVPTDSNYNVTVAPDGSVSVGVVDGQSLDIEGTSRREDWCGAFANDVLGTSFGDGFDEGPNNKMSFVNATVPAAGMAFVQDTGDGIGHVGIVESVNLTDGTMTVVEANWNKGEDGKGIVSRRTMNIADAAGFVKPENSIDTNGVTPIISTLDSDVVSTIKSQADKFKSEDIVSNYNDVANKYLSVEKIVSSETGGPGDLAVVFEFMKALDPTSVVRESEYEAAADSGNIFLGQFAKFNKYFDAQGGFLSGAVKDSFLELVGQKLDVATQQYQNVYDEYARTINNYAGGQNVADEVLIDYSKLLQPQTVETEQTDEQLNYLMQLYDNSNFINEVDDWWNPAITNP